MEKNHTYLLSYPRSGSHWFRYCFVYITKREDVYLGWRYPVGRVTDRDCAEEQARVEEMYPWPDYESYMKSEYTFRGFKLFAQSPLGGPDLIISPQAMAMQLTLDLPPNITLEESLHWPDKCLIIPGDNEVYELDDRLVEKIYSPKSRPPKYFSTNNFSKDSNGTVWMTENWNLDPFRGHFPPLSNYHEADQLMQKDMVVKTGHVQESISVENIKLFCIVRDYKEAVFSECKTNTSADFSEEVKKYMSVLETYDKFPHEKKMMYYEDLIVDPLKTLNENIVNFSGEGLGQTKEDMKKNLELLIEDYSDHQNHSIDNYRQGAGKALSAGKSLDYHRKAAPDEDVIRFDEYVSKNYKYLQEKYLQRYLGE